MVTEKNAGFLQKIAIFCILFLVTTIPEIVSAIPLLIDYEYLTLQRIKFFLIPSLGIFLLLAYFAFFYKKPLPYIFLFGIIATLGFISSIIGGLHIVLLFDLIQRLNIKLRYFSKEIYLLIIVFYLLLGILTVTILPIKRRRELGPKKIIIFFIPLITLLIIAVVLYIFSRVLVEPLEVGPPPMAPIPSPLDTSTW